MPAEILRGHPSVDQVIVFRRKDGVKGARQLWRDLGTAPRPDVSLNFNVYLKSAWPVLARRAPRRIGFDRGRSFDGVALAANEHLPPRSWAHTADMFMEFAEQLGVTQYKHEWRIAFTSDELESQTRFFSRLSAPVATIVPASASVKKDWLPEHWAAVAGSLASNFGFRVVIAGGPGEREQAMAREIVSRSSVPIEWEMGDSVRRMAWIVGGSNLVLAPDTGPVHIARALGVPVIGIYGHTNPWRVGPWRAYSDLWVDKYTESGSAPDPSNRTPRWHVMPTIEPRDVIEKIARAVDNYGVTRNKSHAL